MQQIDSAAVGGTTANNESLAEFIRKSKTRLSAILERLQWTEEAVLERFNTNSKAAKVDEEENAEEDTPIDKSAEEHSEPPLPESFDSKISIVIAPEELRKLVADDSAQIPVKFSDSQVQFTREQRLRLYEYVVKQTGKYTELELQVPAINDGQTTFAEIVAQKRREKKNRRRHRTSKPTQVEEVRGLVELQMQALQQYVETREREQRKNDRKREEQKLKTRRSRSCSRDVARYKHFKHKRRSRSHDSERRTRSLSRSRRKYQKRSHSKSRKKHRKRSHSRDSSRSPSRSRHSKKRDRSRETRNQRKRRSRSRERHGNAKKKLDVLESSRHRVERSPTHRKDRKSSHKDRRSRRSRSGSRTKHHKSKSHAAERLRD